jgi:predicted DsbA family dithiol-disulfide isomerase
VLSDELIAGTAAAAAEIAKPMDNTDVELIRRKKMVRSLVDDTRHDVEEGRRIGVTGTPAFVIGRTSTTGEFEGQLVSGAIPYSTLDSYLRSIVAGDLD